MAVCAAQYRRHANVIRFRDHIHDGVSVCAVRNNIISCSLSGIMRLIIYFLLPSECSGCEAL